MTGQAFKTTNVLKLEVEQTATGPVNLIQNPSGVLGSWGWVTPVAGTALNSTNVGGLLWLFHDRGVTTSSYFYTENLSVAAGQYVSASFWAAVPPNTFVQFEFLNSAGGVISASTAQSVIGTTGPGFGGNLNTYAATVAPAGTVKARLRFNRSGTSSIGLYVTAASVGKAATAGGVTPPTYLQPATYTNVLGPTHTIAVRRDELNLGMLTAEILDATLDPSQSDLVRPGKRVQLMALNASTAKWEPLFSGKVTRGETKYDLKRSDSKRARITLTAVDAASDLASITRPSGVATIAALPFVLEGCGVPWSANGSGNQVSAATVATTNADAKAIDQVAVTRDSVLGYAWVNRLGILNVWDKASISTTVAGTLAESAYSDLALDYDTDRCINSVTVKLRRINVANGQTVEITYGPYLNQASIDQWGAHSAEFTVHGVSDSDAAASAYAAAILTANATPAVRINSVAVPIRSTTDITTSKALLDLYDMVTVSNTNAGISTNMRVTGIEHQITAGGTDAECKWLTTLDFTVANSVASPQATPSLPTPVPTDGGWIEPLTSSGNWINYAGEEPFGYRKINGIVYFKGIIRRNAAGGAADAWVFLPAGYRPRAIGSNGWAQQSVMTNGGMQTLILRADGAMYLFAYAPGIAGYILASDVTPYPADL